MILSRLEPFEIAKMRRREKRYAVHYFFAAPASPVNLSPEHDDAQWFTLDEAFTLALAPGSAYAIHRLMRPPNR